MKYLYSIVSPEASFCVNAESHARAAIRAARNVFGWRADLFVCRYSGSENGNGFFICFKYLCGPAVPQFTWKFHVSR